MPLTLNETLTCLQLCLGSLLLVQAAHLYVNLRGIRENMPCDCYGLNLCTSATPPGDVDDYT